MLRGWEWAQVTGEGWQCVCLEWNGLPHREEAVKSCPGNQLGGRGCVRFIVHPEPWRRRGWVAVTYKKGLKGTWISFVLFNIERVIKKGKKLRIIKFCSGWAVGCEQGDPSPKRSRPHHKLHPYLPLASHVLKKKNKTKTTKPDFPSAQKTMTINQN